MSPSEDDAGRDVEDSTTAVRMDGSGEVVDEADQQAASAFMSESEYSISRADRIREAYDRKFYAPMKILLSDYRGIIGGGILLFYLLMGTVGVAIVPEPTQEAPAMVQWFTDMRWPLGTDPAGVPLLNRVVHSTPYMLQLMAAGGIFGQAMAIGIGLTSGYKKGTVDRVLMTVADTAANLPGLPLLIVLVALLQPTSPILLGIILSINSWAGGARALRAQVLQIRNEDYVEAANAMGITSSRNIQKNVLPELLPIITIRFMYSLQNMVYAAVALFFLGILTPNFNNWGLMLQDAYSTISMTSLVDIHYLMVPLVVISMFGIGATLLAQAFDRVWNPRLRARHARMTVGSSKADLEDESDDRASRLMDR